ncbi:MAG: ImmA/IrrE family metallo-endopeptidase [Clostridium sp.]|uniref:ImmA/IrrE family metallo-endopeptidase n=1 Tax=Clostridium sp. TaxID=1506 RepID=UPI0025BB83C7|nr:ImmA/IrrE family metallo-endopeptidase [Clostridium sp.]MCH3962650.1 ImmA/IrrE family metallo-endopeptidase [Clostridium sp.]MCI2201036.1 ImmA/IrrE family metallo-endopeptidase [Clostridium sp.]
MHSRIKIIVRALIRKYKTNNVYELARCLGVVLKIVPLGSYSGAYMYLNRRRTIFLNSCLNDYERIIVLAHEIGHAVLHKKTNCYFMKSYTLFLTCKIEREANLFAAEFLIKDDVLNDYAGYTFDEIAHIENVSSDLLKLKFDWI